MTRILIFSLLLASVYTCGAHAQGNAAQGLKLAGQICGACHVVSKDQRFAPTLNPPAASFASLARRKDMTDANLRQILESHHEMIGESGGMPNPQLLDYQIDAIAKYFDTLRKR